MATFEIRLLDGRIEQIDAADGYELEGPLTTFYASSGTHAVLDSWSTRLASYRSSDVAIVRRLSSEQGGDAMLSPRREAHPASA